jgi:trans-2,3-dihydro-3-hydroxyanthranilate isomerase
MPHPIHIVDVFAEGPYSGNPLAVVLEAGSLSSETMQSIAREMNYSETTFVVSGPDPEEAFAVRIFTPAEELPFAGHPTLGTAWVLRTCLNPELAAIALDLGVGRVPVRFDGQGLTWLTAPAAEFGPPLPPDAVAGAVGLTPDRLDPSVPAQVVTAGLPVLIVPLKTQAVLRESCLDLDAFAPLAERGVSPFVYLFCGEPVDAAHTLCSRFFFRAGGVREDPATGSAAGCLAAYLANHRYLSKPQFTATIEQGYEISRPSLIRVQVGDGGVLVGGRVRHVVEGQLL